MGGPYQSNATQIINGNYSSTATVAYDFVHETRQIQHTGAVLKSGGQALRATRLRWSKQGTGCGGNTQAQSRQDPTQAFGGGNTAATQDVKITRKDLFVVTSLNRRRIPGEAVTTVTYQDLSVSAR